jgi:hypothetical protein
MEIFSYVMGSRRRQSPSGLGCELGDPDPAHTKAALPNALIPRRMPAKALSSERSI